MKKQALIRASLMALMALFLYSRIATGTLSYYINQRFAWLTLTAVVGFLLLAGSYYIYRPPQYCPSQSETETTHPQPLSWPGLFLIILPILLGFLIPPKPLGAAAMQNREWHIGDFPAIDSTVGRTVTTQALDKNILDWLISFQRTPDLTRFNSQEAQIIGFVYRDEAITQPDTFMVSRFVVSCCVADANPVGLVVRWPDAATLPTDQWIEVRGQFQVDTVNGRTMPILIAQQVIPTEIPEWPYLY